VAKGFRVTHDVGMTPRQVKSHNAKLLRRNKAKGITTTGHRSTGSQRRDGKGRFA
jgi:hypothetical protein